jgi:hypothetical protein
MQILIGPSFLRVGEIRSTWVFPLLPCVACCLRAQILRHGWQAEATRLARPSERKICLGC